MSEERPFGLGKNYPVATPIGEALATHRKWAKRRMSKIDHLKVNDRSAKSAGFVTIWAMGEPRADYAEAANAGDPFAAMLLA